VATINAERINHGGYNYTTKNTNFTADTVQTIYGITATGAAITGYLPLASGNKNLLLGFRLKSGSTHNLVIDASGTDTIDGSGLLTLTPDTKYVEMISDGSGWYELSRELQVTGAGLPSGSIGSIQYKSSSTQFGGSSDLFWDSANKHLLIGGSTPSTANIVLAGVSGQNTIINNSGYDSDLQVKGTGTNQLYFDASTGRLGINTSSPATICHIVGRCASDTLRLESTTQCATGVAITLYHSPSTGSAVGDYPATINLAGRNGNGQQVNYAQIRSRILGTTIGSTSGEIILSVDMSGVSTNIVTANPKRTVIGLNSVSNETNNIIVGNLSKDSGTNNLIFGHNTSISGASSSNTIIFGHSTSVIGSNNLVGGNTSAFSGQNIIGFNTSGNVTGSNIIVNGNLNYLNGSGLIVGGASNSVSGVSGIVYGFNNAVNNTVGSVVGSNHTVNGSGNTVYGLSNIVNGTNNNLVGLSGTITGSGNTVLGSQDNITGSNNILLGNNNAISSSQSGIIIGNNLNVASNTGVLVGVNNNLFSLASGDTVFNTTNSSANFTVYGSSSSSGLYYTNNMLGINRVPSGYALDIHGNTRSSGLYTNTIRVGSSAADQSVLVSDTSGNGSWQPLSTIQSGLLTNVSTNSMVVYNGSGLVGGAGLYSTSTGIVTSSSGTSDPHVIIPTGDSAFIINYNNKSLNPILNVRGIGQNNLFNIDATNNRVGINTASPSYTLHASGTMRVYKDSLYFIEKNNDELIVAYDVGPSTPNRLNISSSGIFVQQPSNGTVLPQHSFVSNPNTTTSNLIKHLVWDTNDNKLKYSNSIVAGFQTFAGSSDS
jgi:hypothetical protein